MAGHTTYCVIVAQRDGLRFDVVRLGTTSHPDGRFMIRAGGHVIATRATEVHAIATCRLIAREYEDDGAIALVERAVDES